MWVGGLSGACSERAVARRPCSAHDGALHTVQYLTPPRNSRRAMDPIRTVLRTPQATKSGNHGRRRTRAGRAVASNTGPVFSLTKTSFGSQIRKARLEQLKSQGGSKGGGQSGGGQGGGGAQGGDEQ